MLYVQSENGFVFFEMVCTRVLLCCTSFSFGFVFFEMVCACFSFGFEFALICHRICGIFHKYPNLRDNLSTEFQVQLYVANGEKTETIGSL